MLCNFVCFESTVLWMCEQQVGERQLVVRQDTSTDSSLSTGCSGEEVQKILEATYKEFVSASVAKTSLCQGVRSVVEKTVRGVVWSKFKFLSDADMRKLNVYNAEGNCLGLILKTMNREHCSVEEKVKFWKQWGTTVRLKIGSMRTTVSGMVKKELMEGIVFLKRCVILSLNFLFVLFVQFIFVQLLFLRI